VFLRHGFDAHTSTTRRHTTTYSKSPPFAFYLSAHWNMTLLLCQIGILKKFQKTALHTACENLKFKRRTNKFGVIC